MLNRIAEVGEIAVTAHYHVEAANALRGMERCGVIETAAMFGALRDLTDLVVTEHLVVGLLLYRAMQLRATATV